MRLAVVMEHRFVRAPGGLMTAGPFAYSFWKRYLSAFDGVSIVARAVDAGGADTGVADLQEPQVQDHLHTVWPTTRADGPGVSFAPLPSYHGPEELLRRVPGVCRALIAALEESDAILLRVPSVLAAVAEPWLRRTRRPFAVEVVGDPWDALAPGAHPHPLRALFRRVLAGSQRRLCAASSAACYVTRRALQRRYPAGPGVLSVGCSDVELPPSAFAAQPRSTSRPLLRPVILTVGSLHHLYKAPDVLIDAVAAGRRNGLDATLILAGEGSCRGTLEARCQRLGIGEHVVFRGQLAFGEGVRRELDRADLFVLPSRQEGLPRALLEAMARGLPAIGTTVGGIPELLAAEDLVAPNDAASLARKIEQVCGNSARLREMSARNLATAREYEEARLARHRTVFLEQVRSETMRRPSQLAGNPRGQRSGP